MGTVTIETRSETIVSSSNGSQGNSETTDTQKRKRVRKKKTLEEQGNMLKNNDITNQNDITDRAASGLEKKCEETGKTTNEGQIYRTENVLSNCTLPVESSQQSCVFPHEEPGADKNHTNSILSTRDNSQPDANMTSSVSKKPRRKTKKKKMDNTLRDRGVDFHTTNAKVAAKCGAKQSAVSADADAMVQRVETDMNADATVLKTQNSESRKRKRKKAKTKEVNDLSENTLAATKDSGSVQSLLEHSNEEDMGNKARYANQELACKELTDKMENSSTPEKNGAQNLGRTNLENERDENTEVNQDVVGAHGGKKRKRNRRKQQISSAVQTTKNEQSKEEMEVETTEVSICGNSSVKDEKREVVSSLSSYVVGQDDVAQGVVSADVAKGVVNLDVVGAQGGKKKKRNRGKKQMSSAVQTTANEQSKKEVEVKTMEESILRNSSVEDEKRVVDSLSSYVVGQDNVAQGVVSADVAQGVVSADVAQGVINLDVVGAQGGKQRKRNRGKKQTSSAVQTTGNEESREEVKMKTIEEPICGNRSVKDEKREVDSFPSFVVGQDTVARGVVSAEIGEHLPTCTCLGDRGKKLLVLDLNGILADVVQDYRGKITPDGKVSGRSVFRRPYLSSFLEFCFERFEVGIWSSRRVGLSTMINIVMRNFANRLIFRMDANICTRTKFKTLENGNKPLVLKDLRRVWDRFKTCKSCGKRKYDETNTLLIDDSPYKALCNPPHTGIFPHSYQHTDLEDSALGPNGDLRQYLERLADAQNVQKFVEDNPFGDPAISESHESWEFYSKVTEGHNRTKTNNNHSKM